MKKDFSRLTRPRNPMPSFVKDELIDLGLMEAYQNHPAYQQNDYIGWITRAKQEKTRQKRLKIMLDKFASGKGCMGMLLIMYLKGEMPKWRWGEKSELQVPVSK